MFPQKTLLTPVNILLMAEAILVLAKESKEIYPSDFEACLETSLVGVKLNEIEKLTIDFRDINYLDIVSALNISAFIQQVVKINLDVKTSIYLPTNEKVLFFFKQWRLDEGFAKAAKVDFFIDLLTEEYKESYKEYCSKIESEKVSYSESYGNISDLNEINAKYHNLCTSKFFGIRSFDIMNANNRAIDTGIINDEVARWDMGDIKEVLNFTLRDIDGHRKEGYIPSNVIFECLTNSLRHPNGDMLQVASRHIGPNVLRNENMPYFTMAFWDNGTSMIDVLKEGYSEHNTVRAELPSHENISYPHFQVRLYENSKFLMETWVDSQIGPDQKYMNEYFEYYWFLAAFFPGVSSDPRGLTRLENKDMKPTQSSDSSVYNHPGMGLYLLLNTVVDIFNGKILVRSGNFLLSIQKPSEKKGKRYAYSAQVKRLNGAIPKFNGNLIAIHLPLWKKQ